MPYTLLESCTMRETVRRALFSFSLRSVLCAVELLCALELDVPASPCSVGVEGTVGGPSGAVASIASCSSCISHASTLLQEASANTARGATNCRDAAAYNFVRVRVRPRTTSALSSAAMRLDRFIFCACDMGGDWASLFSTATANAMSTAQSCCQNKRSSLLL